ncbi:LysR family transcriptional regulator [Herbaspirillum sp. alder98]|uniref:LysR family transcriptional regulator n=1 Tax=Herbaspirillum sp. alder98 TaxID=2913096 RepID=UPI001CD8C9AC|nr:LysR family transcriptional regulator [Herbaspirillum sp. alder98]MCA1325766.1 LysR family transcriptional regulator [Herbaspirillum sp. alder98]
MNKLELDCLSRMAIFARVVEVGAFSRAAKELGLTSSSVSQHIRALETYLGTTLLHRTTRKLSLTEAGSLFYQNCVKVVATAKEAQQDVATLHNQAVGELRVAVSSFMASRYLIPALDRFIRDHPKVAVRIDVCDHNIDLVEHRIDLALRVGRSQAEGDIPLTRLDDVLCAAPAYLDSRPRISRPDELARHDFLLFTPHGESTGIDLTNARGDCVRVRLLPRVSANNALALRLLAVEGHGIARLLRVKIQADLDAGRLRQVLPDWRLDGFCAFITTRHRDEVPLKVKRCIEYIRAYFSMQHPHPHPHPHANA